MPPQAQIGGSTCGMNTHLVSEAINRTEVVFVQRRRCSILVDLGAIGRLFSGLGCTALLPTVIIPAATSNIAAGVQSGAIMRMHRA